MFEQMLFLDIETTGTDPDRDSIIEIGLVRRDHFRGGLIGGSDSRILICPSDLALAEMSDYVRNMHTESGLLHAALSGGCSEEAAGEWLRIELNHRPILAGFSIQFDREFILRKWPFLRKQLHHRIVDVSTIRETVRALGGKLPNQGAPAHTALADCEKAIEEYDYYLSTYFGWVPAPRWS